MISKHVRVRGLWTVFSAGAKIFSPSTVIALGGIGGPRRGRSLIQSFFRRFVAAPVWLALVVAISVVPSRAQAAPTCYCLLETIPGDNSTLGPQQIPLILIHGWHEDKTVWNAFELYFLNSGAASTLRQKYKLYTYSYASDLVSLQQLGQDFRDVLDSDPQNFGSNRQIAIIAHSMGGLVARVFLNEKQNGGSGSPGGERVLKLITLATPHYGAPIANGYSRGDANDKIFWDQINQIDPLYSQGVPYFSYNRKDLHWDNNFDQIHQLDYKDYPDEINSTLGSGLIDYSQKMTMAAMQIADMNV
ncbi:MAG TPA: hypothetical protein VIJ52_08580 [Pseudolabrys sp.]